MTSSENTGTRIALALAGVGKIARDQHIPSCENGSDFVIAAAISRNGKIDSAENFENFDVFLETRKDIRAIALCTPPDVRFAMAKKAIASGLDVLMEKPPAATIGEAQALAEFARDAGVTLFATWHSRFANGVEPARQWLLDKTITRIEITWKEDVRRWHPGQAWIWEAGGFGVFDPGINALSILTAIIPGQTIVEKAALSFPANRQQPIAASLAMRSAEGAPIKAEFDWRQEGPQTWDIVVETDQGTLRLAKGGAELYINETLTVEGPDREYARIYTRFAELVRSRESDVDFQPLRLVADAFLTAERHEVEAFIE
ncbi:gfo/Idh/MocA family oxidoreductase [Agrobacterium vitis]|uniref:Gfo/Idh/MocA family protein n=1 Tax=Agrobacterium vitis TaxID=373 RepID=UPI0012E75E14|nr:Gfo/Idh/MocA family oxidoreductase [Agrobacterium vitis]MCF1454494.1 Gfo/Idh/MocA family oxidoreductase [Agrobacterium vitis]MVA80725.1 gfo/Idh/MocA family oxidoreductase [Agrobacterium vitis]BCH55561.1 dehydrogenase [Agrobacterium vitis]